MSTTTVNEELLRETLEWALREWHKEQAGLPSEWNQQAWMDSVRDVYISRLMRAPEFMKFDDAVAMADKLRLPKSCGTACCIAGRVAVDAGWKPVDDDGEYVKKKGYADERYVSGVARDLLDLPNDALFNGDNTIRDLYVIAGELTDGRIEMPPTIALTEQVTTA